MAKTKGHVGHMGPLLESLEQRLLLSAQFDLALGLGHFADDAVTAVTADSVGDIYVTGQFNGMVDFDPGEEEYDLISEGGADLFVAKYSSAGSLIWARRMGSSGVDAGGAGIAVAKVEIVGYPGLGPRAALRAVAGKGRPCG